jgi:hypothetical protein
VDIVLAMVKRWKLPDLLVKPIERHHSEPGSRARGEPVHQLHRLAYCVGLLKLDANAEPPSPELDAAAERLLESEAPVLADAVHRAVQEFGAMQELFRDMATLTGDLGAIADRAHRQLVGVMDDAMTSQLRRDSRSAPATFSIGGHRVEIEAVESGQAVAYLNDTRGRRLLSHAFTPGEQDARAIIEALGIEHDEEGQRAELETYLRSLAA